MLMIGDSIDFRYCESMYIYFALNKNKDEIEIQRSQNDLFWQRSRELAKKTLFVKFVLNVLDAARIDIG